MRALPVSVVSVCIAISLVGVAPLFSQDQDQYNQLQERAVAARDAGNLRDALGLYEEMQTLDPENGEVAYNRGVLHFDLGEYDQAVMLFTRAVDLGLDDATVYYNLGNARFEGGDLEGALAA